MRIFSSSHIKRFLFYLLNNSYELNITVQVTGHYKGRQYLMTIEKKIAIEDYT